ncbi:MAG: phosphoribosyltransferase family protein [Patescibacteria group bacterium]
MINQETKEKIFDLYAATPNLVGEYPVVVSVGPIPLQTDNRKAFSNPELMDLVTDELLKLVDWHGIDLIVGAETAGMPLATLLSYKTRIPFSYVRKKQRGRGEDTYISGRARPGDRAILVDDLMAKGEAKTLFVENMKHDGVVTVALAMIFKTMAEYFTKNEARENLEVSGIPIYNLFTWEELIDGLYRRGKIDKEIYPHFMDYALHPEVWQKDVSKWDVYFEVLNKLKCQIPQSVINAVDDMRK